MLQDKLCKHVQAATESRELPPHRDGPVAPYLDAASIVQVALETGCDALHPGYGFLSESAELAALCEAKASLTLLGVAIHLLAMLPTTAQLSDLGLGLPCVRATQGVTWVGPRSEAISLFGDKTTARALAIRSKVELRI